MPTEKQPLKGLFRDDPKTKEGKPVEYRDVVGFPGYRVGSDGSVWSCWGKKSLGFGKGSRHFLSDQWILKRPTPNVKSGYLYVMFSGKCLRLVHRLVLEAFIGPCPPGMEACHFPDRDKRNCRLENLRWDTRGANHADMKKHGTDTSGDRHYSRVKPEVIPRGEAHHAAKTDEATVIEIRAQAADGVPRKQLAITHHMSEAQVRRIILRQSWAHV